VKIENVEVYGFRAALRGMRNPMNSWDKSDSKPGNSPAVTGEWGILFPERTEIGPEDMKLALRLIKNGSEHRKFLRQIQIWMDITIPRYVWQELDTYKVATVRNSCSTMHKLGSRDLVQEDFELPIPDSLLVLLNLQGSEFRQAKRVGDKAKEKYIRREYKNLLPEGFLQKATYTFNYETALTMYFQRRGHRLPEWNAKSPGSICAFLASLPYMKEFIGARE
jgi:hypothetical protein